MLPVEGVRMSKMGIRSAASRQLPYHVPQFPSRQSVKDRPAVAVCRFCPRNGPDFGEIGAWVGNRKGLSLAPCA